MENPTVPETPVVSKKNPPLRVPLIVVCLLLVLAGVYWFSPFFRKTAATNEAGEKKFCDGVNIVFFPGGTPTDSFASVVYKGAKAAETALGPRVQYVWSD